MVAMCVQLSAGGINTSAAARCVVPTLSTSSDTCRTQFQDCNISLDQLTESIKSFKCLYETLVDDDDGRLEYLTFHCFSLIYVVFS